MKHRRGSGHSEEATQREGTDPCIEPTGRFARVSFAGGGAATDRSLDEAVVLAKAIQDTVGQALHELHVMAERAGASGAAITHGIDRSLLVLLSTQRIAGELVDLAYLDARRLVLRREPTELGEVVTKSVERYVLPVQRSGVQVDIRQTTKSRIDRDRVQRVIGGFLQSAVTYGYPSSPIVIRVEEHERRASVSISNAGPGLTSAQAHSIFERRYPTGGRPLPIGLYVSRKIVEAHGGEVGVDSTPSIGATFWFALPVMA